MDILRKIKHYWIQFGELLGKIAGPIFLAIIYFIFIGIVALFAFIMRKDFLRQRQWRGQGKGSKVSSYWVSSKKENLDSLKGMELPF